MNGALEVYVKIGVPGPKGWTTKTVQVYAEECDLDRAKILAKQFYDGNGGLGLQCRWTGTIPLNKQDISP